MGKIKIYCDGATEPTNPGGASGIGCVIYQDDKKIKEYSYFIPAKPTNTNNIAEYMSFIRALKWVEEVKPSERNITILGDSQLCIRQLSGEWRIKQGAYVKYAYMAKKLIDDLSSEYVLKFEWVPRELNEVADELSKRELLKHNIKITQRKK